MKLCTVISPRIAVESGVFYGLYGEKNKLDTLPNLFSEENLDR